MPEAVTLSDPIENLGLKHKSQEELAASLLENPNWDDDQRKLVVSAYDLAAELHQHDEYKGQPYVMHLLRVANRITGYLDIDNPEIVAAALMHDLVEDHAVDLLQNSEMDANQARQAALEELGRRFSPRVAGMVAAVSNEPIEKGLSYDEKMAVYQTKVKQATSTVEGFIIKFADWCDNGIGIVHGTRLLTSDQISHFQHKYGGEVLETFETRFRQPDIQAALNNFAKGYVEQQLRLGHQRLIDKEALAEEKKPSLLDKWIRTD